MHDYIKPAAYSCIGDLAMAIGASMEKYLQYWLAALQQGCAAAKLLNDEISTDEGYDEDKRNYLNALCEGIFDGYTGVVQGLKAAQQHMPGATSAFLQPVALQGGCLMLVEIISNDKDKAESVIRTAVGLLGDLAETYGDNVKELLRSKPCRDLITQASDGERDEDTAQIVRWAAQKLGM